MTSSGKLGRVMLIDDERVDQMMYKRILTRSQMADDIVSFMYAEEALAYLTDPDMPPVDLIFLDINMPRMTGFEFLEAVEERLGTKLQTAVVIMLTTSLNQADRERAAKFPRVKGYFNKPLDPEYLYEAARIRSESAAPLI